ncbi:LysR family transcriptional regulator [Pseudomonas gregormendelii]|jgi:DNA-binding transcriptional LysR family regulator|uniref:LysR family transcriptional regulator n=1 Tax=Pseudomonas gregormendelii TaxID=1628277 RepID=A0ABS3APC2_9PSED|nr:MULTISPECIES: LysR family transcriptional regulator [Pseudomonas]KJH75147.1 LysR family transcriptional regulator [Pseudomonas sp. ES3-33]MBN3968221.1 LysR family transcriptional regulator [Pseudomonas gregormendelii]
MDRFQEMQIFMTVAEEEGFAAAARRLNISPPSVTRAIAAMEERIGTQLLSRTTRSLHLTEAGQRYLDDCRRILGEVNEAEEAAAGSYSIPCGHLTVTAPVLFGELYIAPLLAEYLDQFPSVHLHALLVDRVTSMVDEGIDVAIRIGHLHENNQHAIKVGEVRQVICGAPKYFEEFGRPRHPGELGSAKIVMSSASHLLSDWQFENEGNALSFRFDPQLVVTANQAAINIACLGWGVTRVLSYQVASQVAAGELEVVLQDFEPPALPIQVVYLKSNRVPAKIRTFVDFLTERLGCDAALRPPRKSTL